LPPATARVPMVRAMFPVPMMLMLVMMCALFLVLELSPCLVCAGSGQRVGCDVLGQLLLVRYPGIPAYRL
jgi:hypothetical protein